MSFVQFTQPIQTKLHQFCYSFADHFTRPVNDFIYEMVFGILKSGTVLLNSIARSLQEKMALKKTSERLGQHLDKPGLWQQVSQAAVATQAPPLAQMSFRHLRSLRFVQRICTADAEAGQSV